jgi:hypothetical protein
LQSRFVETISSEASIIAENEPGSHYENVVDALYLAIYTYGVIMQFSPEVRRQFLRKIFESVPRHAKELRELRESICLAFEFLRRGLRQREPDTQHFASISW